MRPIPAYFGPRWHKVVQGGSRDSSGGGSCWTRRRPPKRQESRRDLLAPLAAAGGFLRSHIMARSSHGCRTPCTALWSGESGEATEINPRRLSPLVPREKMAMQGETCICARHIEGPARLCRRCTRPSGRGLRPFRRNSCSLGLQHFPKPYNHRREAAMILPRSHPGEGPGIFLSNSLPIRAAFHLGLRELMRLADES